MKLENLVASQKICEEFAAKWPEMFQDSAMVWQYFWSRVLKNLDPWVVVERKRIRETHGGEIFVPAPALEEILKLLPCGTTVHFDFTLSCWLVTLPDRSTWRGDDEKASDAAMRMLMKIKETDNER